MRRPTAASTARYLASSGKRHLFLTGTRGAGKSTLFRGLLTLLAPDMPVLETWAIPGESVWMRGAEEAFRIGVFDPSIAGTTQKMRAETAVLSTKGEEAVDNFLRLPGEWVGIDEIGYLETGCSAYCDVLLRLLDEKRVMAVVRKSNLMFLSALLARRDACVIDLDRPQPDVGCVVMASGLGTRFGGNKLMADLNRRPLIGWTLDATAQFEHRVVVTRHADVADYCRAQGVEVILHELPLRSDTVRLGLQAMPDGIAGCLFCPGDQPMITADSLSAMAMGLSQAPECIWRPAFDGVPGAPVLFPRWAFDELAHLPAGKGGGVLAKRYPDRVRLMPVTDASELMDIDTPEQLADMRCRLREKGE